MSVRILRAVLLGFLLLPVARGGPELPCGGCEICVRDLPSTANPRWTHVTWYDPDDQRLKLTVYSNWVPTWYTYAIPDPNCESFWETCTPPPPEANDPFDFSGDCDGDGRPDFCQILRDPSHGGGDCNGNLRPDACEIADSPDRDACNGNGIPDECEPVTDCNGNGVRDICEIADCAGDPDCADCDGDDLPDGCQLDLFSDCNGNGLLDRCEIENEPNRDCNLNGQLDACLESECVPPFFQPSTWPAPSSDCDLVVWATHCAPVLFSLGEPNAGCTLVEQGSGPPGWYYARLRGCRAGEQVAVTAAALGCEATQAIGIAWQDCNNNRRSDACELAEASAMDCDENGVPDECDPIECGFRGEIEAVGPDALGRYELRIAHCGPVRWDLLDNPGGCPNPLPLAPDGVVQRARLGACITADWVRVRATALDDSTCRREARIPLGCDACADCQADGGVVELGSIRARFPLGRTADGRSLGELVLGAETPDSVLATPAGLRLPRRQARVVATRAPDGTLERVRTPREVFHVATLPAGGFAIEVYLREDFGVGQPLAGALPLRSWRIEQLAEADFALRIEFSRDGQLQRSDLARASWGSRDWELRTHDAGGQLLRRSTSTWTGTQRDVRVWQDGGLARVTRYLYDDAGVLPLTIIQDPNGLAQTTEQRFDSAGRMRSRHDPDGGWQVSDYDEHGRLVREKRGWLDAALAPGGDPNSVPGHTWRYRYHEPFDPNATRPSADEPVAIEESIAGRPVRRWTLQHVDVATEPNLPPAPGLAITRCDPNDLRPCQRTTLLFDAAEPNRIAGIESVGGNYTTITHQTGQLQFDADGQPRIVDDAPRGDRITVVTHLTARGAPPRAGWTTRTRALTPTTVPGWQFSDEQAYLPEAGTSDGYVTLGWRLAWLDEHARVAAVRTSAGAERTVTWQGCCGARTVHDAAGPDLSAEVDALGRLTLLQREGVPDLPGLVQRITRSQSGPLRVITTSRQGADGGPSRITTQEFDRLGRLVRECDPLGRCRQWEYDLTAAGGRRVTRTDADGRQETQAFFRDGRPKRIAGDGVVDRAWSWRVTPAGHVRETERVGPRAAQRWLVRIRDAHGRPTRVLQPTFGNTADPNDASAGTVLRRLYTYDSDRTDSLDDGRLISVRLEQDGVLQQAEMRYEYDPLTGLPTRSGLDHNGDGWLASAAGEVAEQTSTCFLWDGLRAWRQQVRTLQRYNAPAVMMAEVRSAAATATAPRTTLTVDHAGQVRVGAVQTDAQGRQVATITLGARDARGRIMPVGFATQTSLAGVVLAARDPYGVVTTWTRNAFGEATAVTGPAGAFHATYAADGRVASVTDAAGRETRYGYDAQTGLLQFVTDPAGRQRYFAWTAGRQLHRVWGSGVHPTERSYDAFGALVSASTFRAEADWFRPTWPEVAGDARHWVRDPATGLVAGVVDPLGVLTRYDYDALGRTRTRFTAGEPNVPAVQYEYDDPRGRLTSVAYSDGTPGVTLRYHDFGQLAEVTDGAGRRTFAYHDDLSLRAIRFEDDSLFPGRTVALRTKPVRGVGVAVPSTSGATTQPPPLWNEVDHAVRVRAGASGTREYDARYRLDAGSGRPVSLGFGALADVAFQYNDRGQLAETTGPDYALQYSYVPGTPRLQRITLTRDGGAGSTFQYAYDQLDRPVSLHVDGDAAATPLGDLEQWDYNARDELTAVRRYALDPLLDPGVPLPAGTQTFGFDPAGNRVWTDDPNRGETFNAANQQVAGPLGDACIYDAAGRLTSDADWQYGWDADGRLVALDPHDETDGALRVRYRYDARGRRVEEIRARHDGQAWQQVAHRRWLWLGWRPLVIYDVAADGSLQPAEQLAWGPDARGVFDSLPAGGLLARVTADRAEWVIADGNARPRLLLDAEHATSRRLDSDPFGSPLEVPPQDFAWRGAGQQFDRSTGLTYNGARYFRPQWGRWLQPDPLDVAGGGNLYRYVDNRPTDRIDPLGLCGVDLRSLAQESPAFAARAGLPPLIRLDQPRLRLPRLSYAGVSAVGGAVGSAVGGQLPRIAGVAGVVGGGAEVALGVAVTKCSGGLAVPIGVVLIGHGLDTLQAGGRSAWHNRSVDSVTFQVGHAVGTQVGGDVGGLVGGIGLDLGVGMGGSLLSGRLLRLGRLPVGAAGGADCCCCELQFLRADDGLGMPSGVLTVGGLEDARLGVVLNETNELRIRIGDRILELDFEPIRQHDGTLHLMDLDVLDSVGGANALGNSVLLNLFEQLRSEARALGYQRLRISGYRTTGASPGRPVDRCWTLE